MIHPQKGCFFCFFSLNQNMQESKLFPQKTGVNTEIQMSVNRNNNESVCPTRADGREVV